MINENVKNLRGQDYFFAYFSNNSTFHHFFTTQFQFLPFLACSNFPPTLQRQLYLIHHYSSNKFTTKSIKWHMYTILINTKPIILLHHTTITEINQTTQNESNHGSRTKTRKHDPPSNQECKNHTHQSCL